MKPSRWGLPLPLVLVPLLVISLGLAGNSAFNQQKPSGWIIYTIEVEPEMIEQYEDALRGWVDAFRQAKMGPEWKWFATSRSDFTYTLAVPLTSFAELGREEERAQQVEKAIGKTTVEQLLMKEGPAIRTYHTEVVQPVEELSYHPEKPAMTKRAPGFQHIDLEWVRPDMLGQYKDVAKQFRDALAKIKHPFGYQAHRIVVGNGTYGYVWMADSAEQFYRGNKLKQALGQALGKEGADALYKRWRQCLLKFESYDGQPRPDLSYLPMPDTK